MPDFDYPPTREDDVSVAVGGHLIPDPYRWLEDDTSPEVQAWQDEQDMLAARVLRAWPGFDQLAAATREFGRDFTLAAPERHGDRWFRIGSGHVETALQPSGPWKVEPWSATSDGERIASVFPSPDGSSVAVGYLPGGSEAGSLRVFDRSGGRLGDVVLYTTLTAVAWLPDGTGFWFNQPGADLNAETWFHPLNGPPRREPVPAQSFYQAPAVSADGRFVTVTVGNLDRRPAWILDRQGDEGWVDFLPAHAGHCLGDFIGTRYVAVTTLKAPRGRAVTFGPDEANNPSTWTEAVPETDAVLRALSLTRNGVVLSELVDAACRIRLLTRDLEPTRVLPLPSPGTVTRNTREAPMLGTPMVVTSPHHDDITFVHSTYTTSPAIYHHRPDSIGATPVTTPAIRLPATARTDHASGTPTLPYHLVHRDDISTDQPRPVLIAVYGGWNIPQLPRWSPSAALFVAAGGVYVGAVVRGGGEFGADWWHDGRREHKQHTFDDLYRLTEHLITTGITTPELLALQGGSAGGLAAGVALTQRPDLFRAIVANAPALDLLRMHKTPTLAKAALEELGDPEQPDDAPLLASYSPYHNIHDGLAYPAFLACCPEEDIRTPPLHGRKFIAHLQHASASDEPHLLRLWRGIGHGVGITTPTDSSQRLAEWLGFIMDALGLDPPSISELR